MANVSVDTDLLISGGNSLKAVKEGNETCYNKVESLSINSCSSFQNFKDTLKTQFDNYSTHCDIMTSKLKECATELENIESKLIGDKAESNSVTVQSISLMSGTIDYTFDPSNVGISANELYAKATIIRESNLPDNIKVVKMAKLFHEYTLGWVWDNTDLIYNQGWEGTIEMPRKKIVCATGVSDVLYLSGLVDTVANWADQFNPHYQENVLITAQKNGWQKITSDNFDELQPGDIIFTGGSGSSYTHVEIYAGNGYAYSWGSTGDMAAEGPKKVSADSYRRGNCCAYRITNFQTV